MPAEPFFSVVVPTYNHEAFLAEAVESVLAQTFTDWKMVIVNDGSTDGTPAVADALAARDARIRVIHQPNAGLPAARNRGMERCTGRWIALLDSDDLWYPSTLADYRGRISRLGSDARFVYGAFERLEDGKRSPGPNEFQDRPTGIQEFWQRMYLTPSFVTFDRGLVSRVGYFDEQLRHSEDYDYFLRLGRYTQYWPLQKSAGLKRRHGKNLSKQSGRSRMFAALTLEHFLGDLGGRDVVPPQLVAPRLSEIYYSAGRQYFREKFYEQSFDALRRAKAYQSNVKIESLLLAARALKAISRKHDDRPLPHWPRGGR